jgi:MGT family glycosyltransferase
MRRRFASGRRPLIKTLFFVIPAHSDVQSALPVAQELIDRGGEVVFYLTEQFAPQVRRIGASLRPLDPALDLYPQLSGGNPLSSMADVGKVVERLGPLVARLFMDGLRAVPGMIDAVRAERADCIVYNTMCPWGLALARMLGLPAVTFSTTFVMKPGSNFERMFSAGSTGDDPMADTWLRLAETAEELHAAHGLPRFQLGDMFCPDEKLNLVPLTRQFQPDADSLDDRYLFFGPSVTDRGDAGDFPLDRLDGGRVLYASLGTAISRGSGAADFARLCFDAFAGSDWQVVLATGRGTDPGSLGEVPPNFLVRAYVPQLEVLARSDVFVTHGGVNSVMESVWYGVPLVALPHTIEQLMFAGRAAELGLGTWLEPGGVTAPALRDAVRTVAGDPGYRTRMADASAQAKAAGGHTRAAEAIMTAAASVSAPVEVR